MSLDEKAIVGKLKDGSFDVEHEKKMIHFRFISEIDRLMDIHNMNKKDLALKLGTSASYVTQLFRGTKMLNFETLAKIQEVFNVKFDIDAKISIDKIERKHLLLDLQLPEHPVFIKGAERLDLNWKAKTTNKPNLYKMGPIKLGV